MGENIIYVEHFVQKFDKQIEINVVNLSELKYDQYLLLD